MFDLLPKKYDEFNNAVVMSRTDGFGCGVDTLYIPNQDGTWTRKEEHYNYAGMPVKTETQTLKNSEVSLSVRLFYRKARFQKG